MPGSRKKKVNKDIPRTKQMRSYPAVLIGRPGVNINYRKVDEGAKRLGDQLMDFIKTWFIDGGNKTGCRFIVVDSYNDFKPLEYYKNNGFQELFSSEDQEKEFTGFNEDRNLDTRLLYFDLMVLKS